MSETTYVNGMTVKETQYSLKVGVNVQKLIDFLNQHKNEKGYVNIEIKKRKEKSQYGETHFAVLDTWKPTTDNKPIESPELSTQATLDNQSEESQELPF